jgi:hypothetical protein
LTESQDRQNIGMNLTASPFVRNIVIPAAFALLCMACVLADARLGTPYWMTASMDLLLFPIAAAITILALTPGIELLSAKERMVQLGRRVLVMVAAKLGLRTLLLAV